MSRAILGRAARLITGAHGRPATRFITPDGFARIRAEYDELFGIERPKLVEIVAWAAAIGDRSENGDYIYGRKRLREIDRQDLAFVADHESGEGRRPLGAAFARSGAVRRNGRARR